MKNGCLKEDDDSIRLDDTSLLWRYMSFGKLAAMLSESALYFASLASLEDIFEGTLTAKTVKKLEHLVTRKLSRENAGKTLDSGLIADISRLGARTISEHTRGNVLVNCWHANDYESAAMWALYAPNGDGVAIRSTIGRVKAVFDASDGISVQMGQVRYIDYRNVEITPKSPFHIALHKRKSFEHEREIRLLIHSARGEETKSGLSIRVDLSRLIEKVFVAPDAPAYLQNAVKCVCVKFGLHSDVVVGMKDRPLY